ncbi:tetratricopeptide repeat protein [Chitinilyticum piscinae]|uniref:Tetratricopeptide repeat protein n=1 Tax=Chitinilyticum piscinae TaxID=2866724 RepID=A0A8J7FMM0_9NEIS|nr:tetratricopeptide repeat protein [Chitinilyticum piscinae]MBE9608969.1 tetratricopeptide repeat protein [Chitinilyticum piscinae]
MSTLAALNHQLAQARQLTRSNCVEALNQATQAEQLATTLALPSARAKALCCMANAYWLLGDTDRSRQKLAEVQRIALGSDIGHSEGEAALITARNHYTLGEYPQARDFWQRCLTMPDAAIRTEDRILALIGLGQLFFAHEQFQTALAYHQRAEELAASSDDYHLQSGIMINIAADLVQLDRLEDARAVLKDALPLVRADRNVEYEAEIYTHLGHIQLLQGEHDKARMTLLVALKINRLHLKPWSEATNQHLLARCYLQAGDLQHARELLDVSRQLATTLGVQHLQLNILDTQIELHERAQDMNSLPSLREQRNALRSALLRPHLDDMLSTMELRFDAC